MEFESLYAEEINQSFIAYVLFTVTNIRMLTKVKYVICPISNIEITYVFIADVY